VLRTLFADFDLTRGLSGYRTPRELTHEALSLRPG
jgi:hypothetical protein